MCPTRVAGLYGVINICFDGAWDWTSSNPDMSRATTRESKLLSLFVTRLQPFADRDGDGYAGRMGGADCDDENPDIFPGAQDKPGNGIDEDCSGKDAPLPMSNVLPVWALQGAPHSRSTPFKKLHKINKKELVHFSSEVC